MNLQGHDNYQRLFVDGEQVSSGGARSNKRLKMIDWSAMKDRRVLDIGCNAGMLCREAKRNGAAFVMGIERGDVINVAKRLSDEEKLDVEFHQTSMESDEFKKLTEPGFDFVFFCAMLNHVTPGNRVNLMQWIDSITRQSLIYETNFEGKPEKHLDFVRKYTTFDRERSLGQSGDRKPEDYNLYQFYVHGHEPYETLYLPTFTLPLVEVSFATSFYNWKGIKQEKERAKVDKLKDSIKVNGQVRPVSVYRDGSIWKLKEGGHRYIALSELGIENVLVRDISEYIKKKLGDKSCVEGVRG